MHVPDFGNPANHRVRAMRYWVEYVTQVREDIGARAGGKIFERARQASPCVVFFDEIDSLAPNRGRNGDAGGVMDRIVSQLIAELDSLHDSPHIKVFVMAATNRADLIDPSLMTPGRFDKVIEVAPGADVESKTKILKAVSRNLKLADDVDLRSVAEQCEGQWSGAELYSLMSTAAMESMREQIALIEAGKISESDVDGIVSATHIQAAIDKKRTEHLEGIRRKA
ncbi:ATPase, AAA family [Teladorsagia circumcincta]|uniref:Peroxisomal ATPase PEX1 n=1 Tax=Teladorsagia circumcincta TaxID=45464 RepID=A0A2G9UDS8_TELCI|nr:ATPase, AAA family [Teladorsagia circumcincta]